MSSIATAAAEDLGGGPRTTGIARHPLLCFSILTLVLSWLTVIPYALGVFPVPLLPCGPFLAAIITAALVGGRKGLRTYFRRLVQWRANVGWYAVALLAPVAGWVIVAYANVLLGAAPPDPAQLAGWSSIFTATLIFLVNPLTGAWEEPGWRGYALPLLLRRHSALVGSVVLGLMWTLWHLPMFVAGLIPWWDAALVFALTFVFTSIYLRTAGSVPIASSCTPRSTAAAGSSSRCSPETTGPDRTGWRRCSVPWSRSSPSWQPGSVASSARRPVPDDGAGRGHPDLNARI